MVRELGYQASCHSQVNLNAFAAEPARMRDEEIEKLQQFMDAPHLGDRNGNGLRKALGRDVVFSAQQKP